MTSDQGFHAELRKIKAGHPDLHNAYAFLFSALSLARSGNDLWNDADMERCNLSMVFQLATSGLVAPLLFRRLQQKEATSMLPEDFIAALSAFYEANCERNQHHRMVLLEAGSVLNQQGIVPILLKGSHALVGQMPDADARIISDIDLLVPHPKTQQAHQTLLQAEFFHDEKYLGMNDDPALHHHLAPLYHHSGNGYIELHRFPNATRYQPALIGDCFSPKNLKPIEVDGVFFLTNTTIQLLIYNQIHHYYSALAMGKYDIRHLTEQMVLCHLLKENDSLKKMQIYINSIAPNFIRASQLQLDLIRLLFNEDISVIYHDKQINKHLRSTLNLILKNSDEIRKQKIIAIASLFIYAGTKVFDPIWLKTRILNIKWYNTLLQKIRHTIRTGSRLG